jgi:hypothetical protein
MLFHMRRARGVLLRLVRRRALAVSIGAALVAPAAWIEMGSRYEAWWSDGLAIVLGATGAAFIWTGVFGLKPDWTERVDSR